MASVERSRLSSHSQGQRYHSCIETSKVSLNINRYSTTSSQSVDEKKIYKRNTISNDNKQCSPSSSFVKQKSLSFKNFENGQSSQAPRASLLKYEVKKWVDSSANRRDSFKRSQQKFLQTLSDKSSFDNSNLQNNNKDIKKMEPTIEKKIIPSKCSYCAEYKETISKLEKELDKEKNSNEISFLQIEKQLEQSLIERDEFAQNIKKLQKQIKKKDNEIKEEGIQTRRLGIKLEDANYEIGRLRNELYNSQLENEKIAEENEDLAVDNEDLIKDRDEIVQLYDEIYRECTRLKHEVQIWKSIYEANKDKIPNGVCEDNGKDFNNNEDEERSTSSDEEEVGVVQIEEDQSLLLPPRHDITMKTTEPSKLFDILEEIGRGKFGKVYKAMERFTGDLYAAKYVKVTSKLRQNALNTVEIMKKIHHIRVMNLFDVYDLGSQIVIILEHVGGGMLFERILKHKSLNEADCVFYMKQIMQGLHHLHLQNICHLDIKPENIVCVNHKSMDIKIIDFGLAKQLEIKKDIKITAGSPEFVAPEILSFDPVSLASDMWSVGVFTYVLLSGISPFLGDGNNDTLLNVSCGEYDFDDSAFTKISSDAKDFVKLLLVNQPKKRGTTSHCLNHQWFKINPDLRNTNIKLDNMKLFLEKRKDIGTVSAVRAIRRFSSFGVGHGALKPPSKPKMRSPSPSKHLLVPNVIQSSVITEDEETLETGRSCEDEIAFSINTPSVKITRDDSLKSCDGGSRSRAESAEFDVPEDTNTADGLRSYLQRMINEGHLPGREGPPDLDGEGSDEETK